MLPTQLIFFSLFVYFNNLNASLDEPNSKPIPNCLSRKGTCVIQADGGGNYFHFLARAQEMYKQKRKVKIDGLCASSCTYLVNHLYLANKDQVCITPKAIFGIHQARTTLSVGFMVTRTIEYPVPYISPLQDLIDRRGGIPPFDKPIFLYFNELKTVYNVCKD
jgi:hypothetical protein